MKIPLMVAYGGGVNSTALLVGMAERGVVPDAILFADTGGEKPETYAYLVDFSDWLHEKGLPRIIVVRNDGKYVTLERNCLDKETLPSIAFGRKACSDKYKQRPQHKWTKTWQPALDCWAAGARVIKLIGYGADEIRRASIKNDDFYVYCYPLIEWGWRRHDCVEAIQRNGLEVPIKSACFYCPSSRKEEILWLAQHHPDLMERAIAMERRAREGCYGLGSSVAGLARTFSWEKFVEHDRRQMKLFPMPTVDEEGHEEKPSCLCLSPVQEGRGIDKEDEEEDP